jgi:hypothetical protein
MRLFFVIYLPTNTQRQLFAPSAAMAIALTGWPEHLCIAQEAA